MFGSVAVVALYFDGFASLVSVWSGSAAHRFSYLVPGLFLYFTWLRLPDIASMSPRPSPLGLLYATPFGGLWLVSQATQLSIAAHVAAVGMLQAVFLTLLGWRVCRKLLFPLLLLWLMVPFGDLLTPALMALTTDLTIAGLRLVGMSVVADGNILVAGGARYAIIEGCSGLDFLLGNLVISLVFANLMYRGIARQSVYVLASLPVAILANNLRTTSVILITAMTDRDIDLAADHQTYGWFVFFLAVVMQMAVGLRYSDARGDLGSPPDVAATSIEAPPATAHLVAALCGLVLIAAAAPSYAMFVLDRVTEPISVRLCLPPNMPTAREPLDNADTWRPVFPQAHARLHRVLEIDDWPIDFFVAYYWKQGPGNKLIGWGNRLYDGNRWHYMTSDTETIHVDGRPMRVATERLSGPLERRRLVWYWYWVDGQLIYRPWHVKLIQAKAVLLGGDQRAALVAVSTEEHGATAAARGALQTAMDRLPEIAGMLNGATAGSSSSLGRPCP
ncbi:MAG: EpsI family protein [Betaproteobacteria bacterium]|nr:EpsI family protein [Gammaproteobacteria bacterium]MDH3436510.1 EpsI family protein [Betaproteobacteria bacterium]